MKISKNTVIFAGMKQNAVLTVFIWMLTTSVSLVSCSNLGNNETQEDFVVSRNRQLKLKSDSAYSYCRKNNLNTDFCILVNMKTHSGKNRFFVWDMKNDSIIAESLCAHGYGRGSTSEKPVFSNVEGSYCSSLGKYKTGIRSYSQYGINVHYKLHGLEPTNSNAFRRIIVLHSYSLVPDFETAPLHLPLGYSQGCPVINNGLMKQLDTMFKKQKKPTLLWIYYE